MFSATFKEYIANLQKVLQRLRERGAKPKPSKCRLFQKEVSYLGRIVSAEGHRIDPSGTEAVTDLKNVSPKTVQMRKIVGLLGYYRRHIEDFSRIAKPIYNLLKDHEVKGEKDLVNRRIKKAKILTQLPPSHPVEWEEVHQQALNKLIDCITQIPYYDQPFILHTDASEDGLGAVLYQKQGGELRVIGYGSRTLTLAGKKNYHLHSGKLEFLALKWAITEKCRDYLYYNLSFTVYTDNNPLTYVLTTAKLNSTGHRWIAELADFNFDIRYRPGKANVDANSLSRLPANIETLMAECTEELSTDTFAATVAAMNAQHKGDAVWMVALGNTDICQVEERHPRGVQELTPHEIVRTQEEDRFIGKILHYCREGKRPTTQQSIQETPDVQTMLDKRGKLKMGQDGILRRQSGPNLQLLLPRMFHHLVYNLTRKIRHLGSERVVDLARSRFYWAHMQKDIEHYIANVCSSLK